MYNGPHCCSTPSPLKHRISSVLSPAEKGTAATRPEISAVLTLRKHPEASRLCQSPAARKCTRHRTRVTSSCFYSAHADRASCAELCCSPSQRRTEAPRQASQMARPCGPFGQSHCRCPRDLAASTEGQAYLPQSSELNANSTLLLLLRNIAADPRSGTAARSHSHLPSGKVFELTESCTGQLHSSELVCWPGSASTGGRSEKQVQQPSNSHVEPETMTPASAGVGTLSSLGSSEPRPSS